MLTTACCLVVGLGLGLGLDLVFDWSVILHTYLFYIALRWYSTSAQRHVYMYRICRRISPSSRRHGNASFPASLGFLKSRRSGGGGGVSFQVERLRPPPPPQLLQLA